jgi:hypothetical protein
MSDNPLSINSSASADDDWRDRVHPQPELMLVKIHASVWQIALGVFLGNLLLAVLGAIAYAIDK